ncbi:uncharacterized protein BDZ99DRAFT_479887 [Mytilinidion resinicola]|uniref:Uncharacterized protein n=1 Tax=Mytilinidion resinicola TaxID=574789 RepID=A0A6A6YBA5_9PEZI|nr:uncharacterized protein BDZ99DRAFT_479887 [Mytilinidion resinicola]KAF2805858.1 hypothetical protein BDZ99DRAFT_479887 [Mytilinidion resinicola]
MGPKRVKDKTPARKGVARKVSTRSADESSRSNATPAAERLKPLAQQIEESDIPKKFKESLKMTAAERDPKMFPIVDIILQQTYPGFSDRKSDYLVEWEVAWASEDRVKKSVLKYWKDLKTDKDEFGQPRVDTSIENVIINKDYLLPISVGGITLQEATKTALLEIREVEPEGTYSFKLLRQHLRTITTLQEQYRSMLMEHGQLTDHETPRLEELLRCIVTTCTERRVWNPDRVQGLYTLSLPDGDDNLRETVEFLDVENAALEAWSILEGKFQEEPEGSVETFLKDYEDLRVTYLPDPTMGTKPKRAALCFIDLVDTMWNNPLLRIMEAAPKPGHDNTLLEVKFAKSLKVLVPDIVNYAPHMLHENNETLLLARLFYSRDELEQLLRERHIHVRDDWLYECEGKLLLSLQDEHDSRSLEELRKTFDELHEHMQRLLKKE